MSKSKGADPTSGSTVESDKTHALAAVDGDMECSMAAVEWCEMERAMAAVKDGLSVAFRVSRSLPVSGPRGSSSVAEAGPRASSSVVDDGLKTWRS